MRNYSQMHCTDKYPEHSWIIWSVWPIGWAFLYELRGSGSNRAGVTKTLDFAPAFRKNFPDMQATLECGLTLERVRDMIKTCNEMHCIDTYS